MQFRFFILMQMKLFLHEPPAPASTQVQCVFAVETDSWKLLIFFYFQVEVQFAETLDPSFKEFTMTEIFQDGVFQNSTFQDGWVSDTIWLNKTCLKGAFTPCTFSSKSSSCLHCTMADDIISIISFSGDDLWPGQLC